MSDAVPASAPDFSRTLRARFPADVADAVELSARLCAIPGITVPAAKAHLTAVQQTFDITRAAAEQLGLRVIALEADDQHPYPFLIVGFADQGT